MESAGNEYVAQLLDRAATLIRATAIDGASTDSQEHHDWLREYQAEKSRFGQPLGSPAYVDAVQAARGGDADGAIAPAQRHAREAGAGESDEAAAYEDMTVAELQQAARDRGLPVSGTKAELQQRLEDDDRDANDEG